MTKRPTTTPATAPDPEATDARRRRRWIILAVVAVAAAAIAMGVLGSLLLGAGDSVAAKDVMACVPSDESRDFTKAENKENPHEVGGCPPKGAPSVDGLVQEATDTGFDLVTIDGDKRSYPVRPADRPYIDIQHAQSHAALGQPVTIYTKRVDGDDVIIYMTDSTLDFAKSKD
ncbi:MAG: hypothetical protein JWM25_1425 [Thermoleophilia bacterium]|nr:hypothetical protein [Thermoleophilia bacterium]MCZ4496842.1 hypothetical protein [Thermoleophilia bacterium]